MPSPVLKEVPGEIGLQALCPGAQMPREHIAVARKAAGREYDRASRDRLPRAVGRAQLDPFDGAIACDQQPLGGGLVANADTRFQRGTLELPQEGRTAADGLDARRAGAQVVDRSVEGDPVAHEPGDGRRRFGREASDICVVHAPAGDCAQIVLEVW